MSDTPTPTSAELRAMAGKSVARPELYRQLRAGADAMDERDAADGYIAELNAALAQDRAELARLREVVSGLDSACDDEEASHQETLMMLARLRAENAELAEVLRELMASDEWRGPTEQALSRAAAVLAKRESVE